MLKRNKYTRMDDQRKDPPHPKRHPKTNLPKQLQIHDEQKVCHQGTRGTDLLYIDQHILKENRTRRKIAAMAWIDYKKAYDIVSQSCIINCLKRSKYPTKSDSLSRKTWKLE